MSELIRGSFWAAVGERCAVPECAKPRHGRGVCRSHYMQCWRGKFAWPVYTSTAPTKADRFWSKVDRRDDSECWPWLASFFPNGYGQFGHVGAHRASYEINVGPIPAGLVIDHTCGQRYCVNPRHLEPVTQQVNAQRGYVGSVAAVAQRDRSQARTHCINQHELTTENVYVTPKEGWRQCRACKRQTRNARRSSHVDS
jgi:hypothetical protein